MSRYPRGPWRLIAEHVRTRSIKQVQTHGQKYQDKVRRHHRGLHKTTPNSYRVGHRVDELTQTQFTNGCIFRQPSAKRNRRRSSMMTEGQRNHASRKKPVKRMGEHWNDHDSNAIDAPRPASLMETPGETKMAAIHSPQDVYGVDDVTYLLSVEPMPFTSQLHHHSEIESHTVLEALQVLLS